MRITSSHTQARQVVEATLAADCSCSPEDFAMGTVTVVEARECSGRRRYPFPARPLLIVAGRAGVVISAHASCLPWVRKHLGECPPDRIFSGPLVARIAGHIMRGSQEVFGPALTSACSLDTFRPAAEPHGITISVVQRDEIPDLYRHPDFWNALGYRADHPRPDIVATMATRDGAIIGMAGASADCERLWQIGVDVVASEQGAGIGRALVSRLTQAVLDTDHVPFYSTTITNLRSQAVANALGYWPAWSEMAAVDRPIVQS